MNFNRKNVTMLSLIITTIIFALILIAINKFTNFSTNREQKVENIQIIQGNMEINK